MLTRFLLMALLAVTISACSTKQDKAMDDTIPAHSSEREDVSSDPLYGTEITSVDSSVVPGTQEDLVASVGDRVFFGYDRYDLTPEARATLDRQAQWLNQYPNLNITIEGHCDERGTREYNLALGDRRASAVRSYLVAVGVDPRRINTISYGKEQPAVLGSDPSAWAQNRRGVTRID